MEKAFLQYISEQIGIPVEDYKSISGGDISDAYLIKTKADNFFIKINRLVNALVMFEVEKAGLEAISNTHTINAPKVIGTGIFEDTAYLVLKAIVTKTPTAFEMAKFGTQLAFMHKKSSENGKYGFHSDNFIGRLPQLNTWHADWPSFYATERIQVQLDMSKSKRLLFSDEISSIENILKTCQQYLSGKVPSLLHGDLWGGNYLVSKNGIPYLIDPAVYFGHSEVDIAMSKLFGGFSQEFYDAYQEIIPFDELTENRIELYQLYYLLVHLNMFGTSYKHSVMTIIRKYFL